MPVLIFERRNFYGKKKTKWFNLNKLLSYNSVISMVMCYRSAGKTFASKQKVVTEWRKGNQCVWVRRFEKEMEKCKRDFWNVFIQKQVYPDLDFEVKGDVALINGEVAVHFVSLSTSLALKGSEMPKVTYLFFDEYVLTHTGYNHYLKGEMKLLLDLAVSVFRDRKKKLVLLSNTVSYVNPLFTYFNICPKGDEEFIQCGNGQVTIQFYKNEVFKEETLQDDFYKMLEGTEYLDYAINDVPLEDTESFILDIKELSGQKTFIASFLFDGIEVGVWRYDHYNICHCTYDIDKYSKFRYFVNPNESREGLLFLRGNKLSWRVKQVSTAFKDGKLYYHNQEIKKFMENMVKYI